MKENTRRRWMNQLHLLSTGPTFSEFDAVLTAVAGALIDDTTTHRAAQAFKVVMAEFRRCYLAGERDLWIVVPEEGDDVRLATSAGDAAAAAVDVGGLVWMVDLRSRIELARERYHRLAPDSGRSATSIRELRSASRYDARAAVSSTEPSETPSIRRYNSIAVRSVIPATRSVTSRTLDASSPSARTAARRVRY